MSTDQIFWVFGAALGAWLMLHCPRAAIREFKSGVAKGLDPGNHTQRDFSRVAEPIGFWVTIAGTFLAGLMGLFFFVFGIVAIVTGWT